MSSPFPGPASTPRRSTASATTLFTGGVGSVVLFNTLGAGPDGAAFTVWPAQTPGNQFDGANGGTEYFLSSRAVFSDDGTSTSILMWTMGNTASLNTATPSPTLGLTMIGVDQYAVPPLAKQKAGNHPLGDCIADTVIKPNCNTTIAGINSHDNANFVGNHELNSNDSRMQQVFYANGKLWGALDTAVNVGGRGPRRDRVLRDQPAFEEARPAGSGGHRGHRPHLSGARGHRKRARRHRLHADRRQRLPECRLCRPRCESRHGRHSDRRRRCRCLGRIHVATSCSAPGRPRWGDYGAAAVDGNSIWIASEWVAQTCTYATTCSIRPAVARAARSSNWSTRISNVTP